MPLERSAKKDKKKPKITELEPAQSAAVEVKEVPEIVSHARDLDALKDQDPEFYEFLRKNDQNLLKFGQDFQDEESQDEDEDSANEDLDDMDEDEDLEDNVDTSSETSQAEDESIVITPEMVSSWNTAIIEKNSLVAVKKISSALSFMVLTNAEDGRENNSAYRIDDSKVHGLVIISAVQSVPSAILHHLKIPANSNDLPSSSSKWSKFRNLVKSWLRNLQVILEQLTDTDMLQFILGELCRKKAVLFFACFGENSLGRKLVKKSFELWANLPNIKDDEDANELKKFMNMKLSAFVLIRQLAVLSPGSYMELCLKQSYKSFMSVCRNVSHASLSNLNFLQNCLVEIFKLDATFSYQHAFVSIRNIAMKLRNAITQLSQETNKALYNWQTMYALRFWCRCLSEMLVHFGKNEFISKLVYPLVQTSLGVLKYAKGQMHYPLQLHILQALTELSIKSQVYIPVSSVILRLLNDIHVLGRQTASSLKPLEWQLHVRAPNAYLKTRVYVEDFTEKLFNLLVEFMAGWSTSIAFPDMSVMPISLLKKMIKDCKNPKFCKQAKSIVEKTEECRLFILEKRNHVKYGPADIKKCLEEFPKQVGKTPMQTYHENIKRINSIVNHDTTKSDVK